MNSQHGLFINANGINFVWEFGLSDENIWSENIFMKIFWKCFHQFQKTFSFQIFFLNKYFKVKNILQWFLTINEVLFIRHKGASYLCKLRTISSHMNEASLVLDELFARNLK